MLDHATKNRLPPSSYLMIVYDSLEVFENNETTGLDGKSVHLPSKNGDRNYLLAFGDQNESEKIPRYTFRDLVDGITLILLQRERRFRQLVHELGLRVGFELPEKYNALLNYLLQERLIQGKGQNDLLNKQKPQPEVMGGDGDSHLILIQFVLAYCISTNLLTKSGGRKKGGLPPRSIGKNDSGTHVNPLSQRLFNPASRHRGK